MFCQIFSTNSHYKKKITTYKQYIHRRINTIVKQDSQIAHAYIEIIHKL
jgi:hypothetical protein